MDDVTKAYLAGIVDGEGSIGIYTVRSGKGYHSHTLQVTVGMCEPQAVEMIAQATGASASWQGVRGNSKPRLVVTLRSQRAADFLTDILPYLRVKREQAELGIEFQQTKADHMRGPRPNGRAWRMSQEEWLRRESYRQRMYAMNSGRLGARPVNRAGAETEWMGAAQAVMRQSDLHGNMQSAAEMTAPASDGE